MGGSWSLVLSLGVLFLWGWIYSLLADELLQLSLSDKGFHLLLQVVAIGCVVTMVTVEAVIFVPRSFVRITLQLSRKRQGPFVLNLH